MSIKSRIYLSFALLTLLFVINAIVTVIILQQNKKQALQISEVINPSVAKMESLEKMLIESKMYTTNWVFLRSKREDKDALKKIHSETYPALIKQLNDYSSQWANSMLADSLKKVNTEFDEVLASEKKVMTSLQTFDDYDNPMIKFRAEEIVEDELLPEIQQLMQSLNFIITRNESIRKEAETNFEHSSVQLRYFISGLAITIILLGIFLSIYFSNIITEPLKKIGKIVNDMGRGVISKYNERISNDEIGEMEMSVNNLSEKLATMATFAQEVGERNFEAEYQPLSREDVLGEALVVMRNNIRRSDENLRAKNEALTKTNMELDKFVYSVSHDLRAPLSSMLGVIDLSLEQTEDPLMSKHFEMLKSSVKKLDAFIQDILDYSRNARMEVMSEKIDFKELIHDITGNLKFMSGTNRRVEIKTNIHESQPFYGDRNRLSVVLNNLVSNAIRYQDVEKENPFVDISIDASATEAIIRISDNGIGISKEHHQKIFEMFYRVSDRSVGSGLGLYLVKDVMDKLGGTIQMESTPGQGTAFNLWIPAVVALHQ